MAFIAAEGRVDTMSWSPKQFRLLPAWGEFIAPGMEGGDMRNGNAYAFRASME